MRDLKKSDHPSRSLGSDNDSGCIPGPGPGPMVPKDKPRAFKSLEKQVAATLTPKKSYYQLVD